MIMALANWRLGARGKDSAARDYDTLMMFAFAADALLFSLGAVFLLETFGR